MTREEAIALFEKQLTAAQVVLDSGFGSNPGENNFLYRRRKEMAEIALTALRTISREQVEKVWRGGWEPGNPICPICGKDKFDGLDADIWADWMPNFCPHCGAPMTDKAVDMVMERLEALHSETKTD